MLRIPGTSSLAQFEENLAAASICLSAKEGLLAPGMEGRAMLCLATPGTAYDNPILGKDPQPPDMRHYGKTESDNGGVHINSGILDRGFHLTAVAIGGFAWEKAGRIWYEALCDGWETVGVWPASSAAGRKASTKGPRRVARAQTAPPV
jgi:Zn-dependent metalloprotease